MSIEIEPYEIITKKYITNIRIILIYLEFNISAKFRVYYDENITDIIIDGDEYKNWGHDDNYILDIILCKFGLKRKCLINPVSDQPLSDQTVSDQPLSDQTVSDQPV